MQVEIKIGDVVEAEITRITSFGAFVKINGASTGLIHISQISNSFVKDIAEHLKVGDKVKVRVIKLGPDKKIDLSLKIRGTSNSIQRNNSGAVGRRAGFKSSDFEAKLKGFLQQSQHSLVNLKRRSEKYHR